MDKTYSSEPNSLFVSQNNSPHIKEQESSLPCSQQSACYPYFEKNK
jgi:hypothetical protein